VKIVDIDRDRRESCFDKGGVNVKNRTGLLLLSVCSDFTKIYLLKNGRNMLRSYFDKELVEVCLALFMSLKAVMEVNWRNRAKFAFGF
jgi:hypothetical protein